MNQKLIQMNGIDVGMALGDGLFAAPEGEDKYIVRSTHGEREPRVIGVLHKGNDGYIAKCRKGVQHGVADSLKAAAATLPTEVKRI